MILILAKSFNVISSYILKCANIIGDVVDLNGMKMIEIPKAQKWWKELNELQKLICTSMLEVYCVLNSLEEEKLIKYMGSYQ